MFEEEISIQGVMPGRPESPTLEAESRKQIEFAVRTLIESKTLYQNVRVDLDAVDKQLAPIGEKFVQNFDFEKQKKGVTDAQLQKIHAEGSKHWEQRRQLFLAEIPHRPWKMKTRHQGDNRTFESIIAASSQGITQPLETPNKERDLCFYAPPVQLFCANCKGKTSFEALAGSTEGGFAGPYPLMFSGDRVQVYLIFYRCGICREELNSVLIQRSGLKLSLCGFAPRKKQQSERKISKALLPIYQDAVNAVAEGDVFAGFYHARTLLEHFLRLNLKMPLDAQERGDDLIVKYQTGLSPKLKEALPALSAIFSPLSQHLHARTGTKEDFDRLFDQLCAHMEAVEMLSKFH